MDADAAGILGLLLGGAGGYYGGKKRAEREASDMEKLIAMYRGEDDDTESKSATEILNEYTPYGSQSGDLSGNKSDISTDSFIEDLDTGGLSVNLDSGISPFAAALTGMGAYFAPYLTGAGLGGYGIYDKFINQNPETNLRLKKADPSVGEPIVLFPESLQNIERSPEDYLGAEAAGLLDYRFGDPVIDFNPEETAMNKLLRLGPSFYDYNLGKKDGGRIGYEPGGKVSLKDKLIYGGTGAGLYELLPAINDYINFINFNQGGRVGYEQGGIVDLYKRMNHG